MIEIKLYKHPCYEGIYLARNWHICGGNSETEFYYATEDVMVALESANKKGFESWMHSFLDDEGKTKLKAKITFSKEVDVDGYKGICKKEVVIPVKEFIVAKLIEKEWAEPPKGE